MIPADTTSNSIRFIGVLWRHLLLEQLPYPCVVVERGRPWDDSGYRTLFQVYFLPARGTREERPDDVAQRSLDDLFQYLGPVKILQRGVHVTRLPEEEFGRLDDHYCSLGQSLEYYERLHGLGDVGKAILDGLRDIAIFPRIESEFADEEGLAISLQRSQEAQIALRQASSLLGETSMGEKQGVSENVDSFFPAAGFEFSCSLDGFDAAHCIHCKFFPVDGPLGRMVAVVGKNATGKTALLRAMSRRISGLDASAGTSDPIVLPFSRVIVISYSAFDSFTFYEPGRPREAIAYYYCGLRNDRGKIDIDAAFDRLKQRMTRLENSAHQSKWCAALHQSGIFEAEPALDDPFQTGDFERFVDQMRLMSAGHKIFLFVLSSLADTLRTGALLLFDEPELHLHPNLLSSLMRLLHALLKEFESYAIIATHSSQILQEIPARSIHIVERHGNIPSIRPYPRESFGANLGEITNLAFAVDEQERNFRRVLETAHDDAPNRFDERITEIFRQPMGLAPYRLLQRLRRRGDGGEGA